MCVPWVYYAYLNRGVGVQGKEEVTEVGSLFLYILSV